MFIFRQNNLYGASSSSHNKGFRGIHQNHLKKKFEITIKRITIQLSNRFGSFWRISSVKVIKVMILNKIK